MRLHRIFKVFCFFGLALAPLVYASDTNAIQVKSDSDSTDAYVTQEDLVASLKSENIDKILEVTNKIKAMQYKGEVLPLVEDLWSYKNLDKLGVKTEILEKDIVRIEFVEILAQAESNGFYEIDTEEMHEYLLSALGSPDRFVVRNALLAIYVFDSESDVEPISEIASKSGQGLFRSAIWALNFMCNDRARTELDHLVETLDDKEKVEFIVESRGHRRTCD